MDDLDALRVFEVERPAPGAKFIAIMLLLREGVPSGGITQLIRRSPWPVESKAKWEFKQLPKLIVKANAEPLEPIDPYDLVDARSVSDFFAFCSALQVAEVRRRG